MKIKVEVNASIGNLLKSGIELSAKAIGTYAVLLEADENKKYDGIREYLQTYVADGYCAIKTGLDELMEKGFLVKTISRTPRGVFSRTEYIVTLPKNGEKQ